MKMNFNDNWTYYREGQETEREAVTLPHDAMRCERRTQDSAGGINTGWYEGYDYVYEKSFTVPPSLADKTVLLEFEGVYRRAEVFLNGRKAAFRPFGYTGFVVFATPYLVIGAENTVRVIAKNADQPNSRWYSGAGIYRPVTMHVLPEEHILPNGIRITTEDYERRRVRIDVVTAGSGEVSFEVAHGDTILCTGTGFCSEKVVFTEELEGTELWSVDQPNLYTLRVQFSGNIYEETFGIRTIACNSGEGLRINGKRVILQGACIHHDNGLLGAAAHPFAEERKIRILKENGYNAVRSAHNPCSKALLDACDRLGMLVMDEYADVWYIHKTKYDYAGTLEKWWRQDLSDMADKDYNHPSVILYSIGNEVSETAQQKGIDLCREMTAHLHALDNSRPVTCGINIFFNLLSSMGFGVYSDSKAEKGRSVGSEFFNNIAGVFGDKAMKIGASLPACDKKTRDAFAELDVAGYNYGILRYQKDMKKYPNRVILGSETFCNDAYKFYETAKKCPALIGDFVWAGMDYLGEVGIGSWEYRQYAKDFKHNAGWISAGSGRIDITGKPLGEMAYTRVAFELDPIRIAVVPADSYGEPHSPSAWKMTNATESWSWNGCEGRKTAVEVYTRAYAAGLYLNGKKIGFKKRKKDCRIRFLVKYRAGELTAVAYDSSMRQVAHTSLRSAGSETKLSALPEQDTVSAERDLCYVRLCYTDENGTVKPLLRGEISVSVVNGRLLALGHACPYNEQGYLSSVTDTYYGEALAIVKPSGTGCVKLTATGKFGTAEACIGIREE